MFENSYFLSKIVLTVSNYCSSDQEKQECNDVVSPTLKPDTPATSLKMTCAKSRVS